MKTILQWFQKAAGIWFTCTGVLLFILYLSFNFSMSEKHFSMYLLAFGAAAVIAAAIWQRCQHQIPSQLIFEIIRTILAACLASFFIFYGMVKLYNLQFAVPAEIAETKAKDLTGFWKMWVFYAHSGMYNRILGSMELLAALLLLFSRTRLAGLLLYLAMMMNIVVADYLFGVVAMQTTSLLMTLMGLYLLHFDWKRLAAVLFSVQGKTVAAPGVQYTKTGMRINRYVWLVSTAAVLVFTVKDICFWNKI